MWWCGRTAVCAAESLSRAVAPHGTPHGAPLMGPKAPWCTGRSGSSPRPAVFYIRRAKAAMCLHACLLPVCCPMQDELGRGTATHDGVAIASATLQYLVHSKRCVLRQKTTAWWNATAAALSWRLHQHGGRACDAPAHRRWLSRAPRCLTLFVTHYPEVSQMSHGCAEFGFVRAFRAFSFPNGALPPVAWLTPWCTLACHTVLGNTMCSSTTELMVHVTGAGMPVSGAQGGPLTPTQTATAG